MLVLSPLASVEGRAQLVELTKCEYMLYGEGFRDVVKDTVRLRPLTKDLAVSPLADWLKDEPLRHYPYTRSWADAWQDPVAIFHSSGTTGLPKPITWTNAMMRYNDGASRLPRGKENHTGRIGRTRYYTTTGNGPGVSSALQASVWLGAVIVLGPAHRWPDPDLVVEMLTYGEVGAMLTTPHVIEAMALTEDGMKALLGLKILLWTGASLGARVGAAIASRGSVLMAPVYGSTECAGLQMHFCADRADWDVYEFQDGQGIEFEAQSGSELHELVIRRWKKNDLDQPITQHDYIQPVFCSFPQLDEWRSRDLFTPHENREKTGLWRYRGRKDDMVTLSSGAALLPTRFEPLIATHDAVRGALIGGQGKPSLFLLVQLADDRCGRASQDQFNDIWATVEAKVNIPFLGGGLKLRRDKVLIATQEKPFVWAEKGTFSRRAVLDLYKAEIEALYS